jgi:hypothetical protein
MGAGHEKPEGTKKHIPDVEKPGKSAPAATSKPVLVSNRPILKDPMVVEKADGEDGQAEAESHGKKDLSHGNPPVIQPSDEPKPDDKPSEPSAVSSEPPKTDEPETPNKSPEDEPASPKVAEPEPAGSDQTKPTTDAEKKLAAEAAKRAEHEAEIQRLVDEGHYILPINTTEKRKAKRFMALGVVLAVLLVLAWLDIALDARIISLGGLHAPTHFFSN